MVISRDINKVRSVTEKRIADRKKSFNDRKKSSNSNNEPKEYLTIVNRKVVVTNSQGDIIRTTLTPSESQQAKGLISDYNKQYVQQTKDIKKSNEITKKVNQGTATNRDYVDYLNISTKYGTDMNNVKTAINVGETNKANRNFKPINNDFYTPEKGYIAANPNMNIEKNQKIKRDYNDKGDIVGLEGGSLQMSIAAPQDSFFSESKVKNLELTSQATIDIAKRNQKAKNEASVDYFLEQKFKTATDFVVNFKDNFSDKFKERSRGLKRAREEGINDFNKFLTKINLKSDKEFNRETSALELLDRADDFIANNVLVMARNKNGTYVDPAQRLINSRGKSFNQVIGDEFKNTEIIPLYQGIGEFGASAKDFSRSLLQKTYSDWDKPGNPFLDKVLKPIAPAAESPTKTLRNTANVALTTGSGLVSHAAVDLAYIGAKKPLTTTGTIGSIVVVNSILPGTAGVAGTAFSVQDWLSRPTASDKALAFGGDAAISALSWGLPRVVEAGVTKLDPSYSKVNVDNFGRKKVAGVKTKGDSVIDIDLVPQGKRGVLDVDVKGVLKDYKGDIPYKTGELTLPKANSLKQQQIIDVFRGGDEAFSGSFSQQVLLKKEFNRGFDDLDIGSKNPDVTASKILSNIDNVNVRQQPTALTIFDTKTGKDLVDIVPLKVSEGGYATKYPFIEVDGINLIDARARLAGKSQALSQGIKLDKTTKDINFLTGGEAAIDVRSQNIKGAFGFTFLEQSEFVGKTGNIITAQQGFFPSKLIGKFKDDVVISKPNYEGITNDLEASFFASSWDIKTGNPQLRGSRLGISNAANFDDLFSGNVQIGRGKSQAILFEQHRVANIPDNLKPLEIAAKKGGEGSLAYNKFFKEYREFQMTPTGEFKPYGFAGGEAELTLSPFEVVRGKGKIGVTLINNQKVNIVQAEVVKASPELASLQIKELDNSLSKTDVVKLNELRDFESRGLSKSSSPNSKPFIEPMDYAGSFNRNNTSLFIKNSALSVPSSIRGTSSVTSLAASEGVSLKSIGSLNKDYSFGSSSIALSSSVKSSPNSRGSLSKYSSYSPVSFLSPQSSSPFANYPYSASSPIRSTSIGSSPSPYRGFNSIPPTSPQIYNFNFRPKQGKGVKGFNFFKGGSQFTAYNPTITSITFGLKGKSSPFGIKSGLGLRPVMKTNKKLNLGGF